MISARPSPQLLRQACRKHRIPPISRRKLSTSGLDRSYAAFKRVPRRHFRLLVVLGAGASCIYGIERLRLKELHAEPAVAQVEEKVGRPIGKRGLSKEENRDQISSQHLQVKRSWENPGVYAWGSNSGRVAAPDSEDNFIKSPRRIPFFNGQLLRDVKLDREFGAAIDDRGDLLQWGTGYSKSTTQPTPTLTGKNLISISISRDRIIGLSASGKIYSLPVSSEDQATGPKTIESSWIPFMSSTCPISYRIIKPPDLGYTESVTSISSGLEHLLILTSSGRLFSTASSSSEYPSRGQLGIPGLTWATRPPGAYDLPHEITTLRGFNITKIAAGDYHSLAVDNDGRVFAFGDNSLGQAGFDYNPEAPLIDSPSLLPISKLYAGTSQVPRVTSVAAGGVNSFFTIDATSVTPQLYTSPYQTSTEPNSRLPPGRVTSDTWSCGQGIFGGLGNGRWTHMQGTPVKVKALSGLFEYDEAANKVIPIRLRRLSVGSTHASATMSNVTHLGAHAASSENDTNWGADVVWWGGNEFYQLGTGRRNNISQPTYIKPLDALDVGRERGEKKGEEHRFQITPRGVAKLGDGRTVSMEQRVECGRFVTAVYSGV